MINRDLLKQVILEQREIPLPPDYIDRQINLHIGPLLSSELIVIITGIRRCGKSIVLKNIRKQRQEDYYINFDDDRLVNFTLEDFQILYEVFVELFGVQKSFYFDEIQNIDGWERFIRRLHDHGNKVFITGSNATMLSKELGTRLTGRHVTITLYPYSFHEYIKYKDSSLLELIKSNSTFTTTQTGQLYSLFAQYLHVGGIPGYVKENQPEYINALYENILYKDIIVRYKLTKEHELRQLGFFIASNIGKKITFNSIRKMLKLGNASTISEYYGYLENSYLCFIINSYSASLKKQIAIEKKQYIIDHGMARLIGFRTSEDFGQLLENIVFIELKRKGKTIFANNSSSECDFVLHENHRISAAIQVCKNLDDTQTYEREYRGLLTAMNEHQINEGLILTEATQRTDKVTLDGRSYTIQVMPIWKWLLNN